jgi:hypothetical protein
MQLFMFQYIGVLNRIMEEEKKKSKRGGFREGAGRPKGSKDQITIYGLLSAIESKAKGKNYEQLLVEDFLQARDSGNEALTIKYHNLILNKVMNSLAKIEVTDSEETVQAKQAAFAEALAKLAGINPE